MAYDYDPLSIIGNDGPKKGMDKRVEDQGQRMGTMSRRFPLVCMTDPTDRLFHKQGKMNKSLDPISLMSLSGHEYDYIVNMGLRGGRESLAVK